VADTRPEHTSIESEQHVCGAILLDGRRTIELSSGRIKPEFFTDQRHRTIVAAAFDLEAEGKPIAIDSVYAHLQTTHRLGDITAAYLSKLLSAVATPEMAGFHVAELRRLHVLRSLRNLHLGSADALTNGAARDPSRAISDVTESLDALQEELAGSSDLVARAVPGTSLATMPLTAQPSYWGQGLIPGAEISVLVGTAGTGKTWLAFQLAVALALGEPFLGIETRAARVGIVELENPMIKVRERLDAVLEGREQDEQHRALDSLSILARDTLGRRRLKMADDWRAVARWIRAAKLDVVIVDSLQRTHGGDEMGELAGCVTAYERVLDATSAAIVPLHHERKPAQENGKKREPSRSDHLAASRGLAMLTDGAKAVWRLVDGPQPGRTLYFAKVNNGPPLDPIFVVQGSTGTFSVSHLPESRKEQGEANARRVREAIEEAGVHGITTEKIVELTGLVARTCQRHANAAGAAHVDGRWYLVEDGGLL